MTGKRNNPSIGSQRQKRAKLWARVADDIKPLKEPSTIGGALTEDDKQRLLKTAVMRPEWETAHLAAILCLNTTAQGCELKGLHWADVDLFSRTLRIKAIGKRKGRPRNEVRQAEAFSSEVLIFRKNPRFTEANSEERSFLDIVAGVDVLPDRKTCWF